MLEVPAVGRTELVQVFCARRLFGIPYRSRVGDGVVLVLRDPGRPEHPGLGLMVDDVLTVLEFDSRQMHAAPAGFSGFAPWIGGLLDCRAQGQHHDGVELIQALDAHRLLSALAPHLLPPEPLHPDAPATPAPPRTWALAA